MRIFIALLAFLPAVYAADCDFDNGLCGWTNKHGTDVFDWTLQKGPTRSSSTGPSADHTQGNSNGYYLYIETSSPRVLGDNAVLQSNSIAGSSRPSCLEFWYHMYGSNIGELRVALQTTKKSILWLLKGQQGNSWMKAAVPISPNSGSFKILIEGIRGKSYRGDIAIDDLKYSAKPCQISPLTAHPSTSTKPKPKPTGSTSTGSASDIYNKQKNNQWFKDGVEFIKHSINVKIINKKAKNVILFVGDGMGVSTVTAARILDGQNKGNTGEENVLSWEKFPYSALSKTYNTDQQVPDSAGTATAFMTGVKAKAGVISVDENAVPANCQTFPGKSVLSIAEMAELNGLSTGVVSTARVTHATPATAYSHSPHRNYEASAPSGCRDIASQLIDFPYGDGLEVVLGGGRENFFPNTVRDPEDNRAAKRKDRRNLSEEWVRKSTSNISWQYVWNERGFKNLDVNNVDHVLGLFSRSHMNYAADRVNDVAGEPSLTDMTEFAINMLSKNQKGYFLLVEGGRVDHGHHGSKAYHALHDAIEMANAVEKAAAMTREDDTLIIVTADHSHVFTIGGYQKRGNPILGLTNGHAKDGKRWTTLGYYTGSEATINTPRADPGKTDTTAKSYKQQSLVPLGGETHGGEDVAIYSRGPQSHLVHGVMEQNAIFHVMDYALCLSDSKKPLCRSQSIL